MTRVQKLGMWIGLYCVFSAITLFASSAVLAEEVMEEIIVTGSYIRRDSFDSASPLTVIDHEAIQANATPNLGEVLVNQTFNYGSQFQANIYSARPQLPFTSANLRGLGARATLQLVDGMRTLIGVLNSRLPLIAIERIDILRDGAAALYGSDAVAGVVNIIPRKNVTGAELSVFYTQTDDSDLNEIQYEFIAGGHTDNGHFTLAGSYQSRSNLQQVERPRFLRQGFEFSGTGNPGDWLVPTRDPTTGALDGSASRLTDPGCGVVNGPGGTDVGQKRNHISGERNPTGTNCRLHFGEWHGYMTAQDSWNIWTNYEHAFTDGLVNEIDVWVLKGDNDGRNSASAPGGRTEEFPIVLGNHPGNPYRAFADANANGVIDPGEHLFALDADGDNVPDRDPAADVNGDGVPDVILHPSAFDPMGGGIAFNEDVDVVALRTVGKLGTLPTELNGDGSTPTSLDFFATRLWDTVTYSLPGSSWQIAGTVLWDYLDVNDINVDSSQARLVAGLNGELVTSPTASGPTYWNPFSTQQLSCTDRLCTDTGTPDFANTQEVVDSVDIRPNDIVETEAMELRLIASGDLYEIPTGGTMAGAFGLGYRRVQTDNNFNETANACDAHIGGCAFDYQAEQDYVIAFFELAIPIIDTLDIQIAGGYSDYGEDIGDSFDPKFAIMYRPLDILSLRGSWSSAFIAPSLADQFAPELCGIQPANDALTQDFSQSFRSACRSGNPNLDPESATVWNVGASLVLLDSDLNVGVDYAQYDFEDRISVTTMNQILTRDFNRFLAAGGDVTDPVGVQDWIDNFEDPAIQRDSTNVLTRVATSRINAQKMKHVAWDFYGRYSRSFDLFGNFTWGLSATYVDEYSYDLGQGIPPGDGAGSQNESVAEVPPMPKWRVNGTVNWLRGNHSAFLRVRRISEFDLDFNSAGLQAFHVAVNGFDVMDPMTYTDLQYGYRFTDLFGTLQEARIEAGVRNVFDEFPEVLLNLGGIETFLHDVRGRMWYLRLNVDI